MVLSLRFPLCPSSARKNFATFLFRFFYKKKSKAVSYAIISVLFLRPFFLVLAERHASYFSSSPQPPPLAASSWRRRRREKKFPRSPQQKFNSLFFFPFPSVLPKTVVAPPQAKIMILLFFFSYLANHEFSLSSSTFSSFSFLPIPLTFCKKSRHRPIVISFPSSPSLNLQAALHLHFRHSSG